MRLLHSETLTFHDFVAADVPRYAILSHTWSSETTYQDFLSNGWRRADGSADRPSTHGIDKVLSFAEIARKAGYAWIWVDTCCIDKTSSTELSESINSMFRWYQKAAICYVHLSDLDLDSEVPPLSQLPHCRWFTRSWTLQELLAPNNVVFYDARWRYVSAEKDIRAEICAITGIPFTTLSFRMSPNRARRPLEQHTVAERMKWAARRQATRAEDTAYCLLGIFDINMSLRYGEGDHAFARLQRKILKTTTDETLFAWGWEAQAEDHQIPQSFVSLTLSGLLAPHPRHFKDTPSSMIAPSERRIVPQPITLTPRGLEFSIFGDMAQEQHEYWTDVSFPLDCALAERPGDYVVVTLTMAYSVWYRNVGFGVDTLSCDGLRDVDRVAVAYRDDQRWTRFYVADHKAPFTHISYGNDKIIRRRSETASLTSSSQGRDLFHDSQLPIFIRGMLVRFFGQEMHAGSWSRTLAWDQLEYFIQKKTLPPTHSLVTIYEVAKIARKTYPQQTDSGHIDPFFDMRIIIDCSERKDAKKFAKYYDRDDNSTRLGLMLFMRTLYYKDSWSDERGKAPLADRVASRIGTKIRSLYGGSSNERQEAPVTRSKQERLERTNG